MDQITLFWGFLCLLSLALVAWSYTDSFKRWNNS